MEPNFLNNLLLEWAVRSPDGLVLGHNTPENQRILSELISEVQPRKLSARQIAKAERDTAEKARVAGINPDELSAESLKDIKEIKEKISEILAIAERSPELKANYNQLSLEQAIEFVNKNLPGVQEMVQLKASTLGEGELILVFLIRGAISGGTKSGDIEVDNKKIDVKKVDGWKFRVELASFDGFSSTEFNAAISELINFSTDKKNAEVLKKMVDSVEDSSISNSVARAKQFKETTKRFFDSPDVELLRRGVVLGLVGIGMHLRTLERGKPAADYADFVIDHDKTTVNVDNSKEIEKIIKQQSIKGPEAQPQTVTVKVSPIDDEESQMIIPKIKRLKYFVDRFGPVNIAKNVLPKLHYDAIIFYDPSRKIGGKSFTMMTNEEVANRFEFYGWAKAPVFSLLSRPDDSYSGEEDLENLST